MIKDSNMSVKSIWEQIIEHLENKMRTVYIKIFRIRHILPKLF